MTQSTIQSLVQGVAIFIAAQFVVNQFFGSKDSSGGSNVGAPVKGPKGIPDFAERTERTVIENYSSQPQFIRPIWPMDSTIDVSAYISPSLVMPKLSSLPRNYLVMQEKNFTIGDYKDKRDVSTTIQVPTEVQQNATLWLHIYMALSGHEQDPLAKGYDFSKATHSVKALTNYDKKKVVKKLKNLLDKSEDVEKEDGHPQEKIIANYYHPNFTLSLIPDSGTQQYPNMHPALIKNIILEPSGARDESGQNGWYYPIVFMNQFWQLNSQKTELNSTAKTIPLNIQLNNMANWKYSIFASIDEGMKQNQAQAAAGTPNPMAGDGSEMDKLKEILLDTNSYLLGTTVFVSILHMFFEALAFKNDISHWRKKKDVIGTSVRTIVANVFMQTIIFLYLMDNNENTSWMILAGQGFGILIEAWKITKTVDVRLRAPGPDSNFKFLPYVVTFEDKYKLSETEIKTQEYDEIAFRYLYIAAIPLLLAYAGYSLVYESHKSWYSFVIETLVGSVYAYGFLMMVPSLYINYRLKSVAHMPSKAMTYKFLNTFIDDLFAFTIRMPTLHRLATLRDDVIFFVWLYQKYKYKVDYTRVNEFGQGGESDDEGEKENGDKKDRKLIDQGQSTKEVHPTAAVAEASGAEKNLGAKKRK